ncbi:hypothetical protein [Nocardioides lijunqiniae]|uniref:hypothetical protein n=1 Tax=Nocardioides lijunqiniae TaxID=2760832 RepID=UPI001878FC64|nr:hypothetical protein [Nocardioides lijunqiniae]
MRTLRRRLAPHSRTAWLTFAAVAVVTLVVAISIVVLNDGGRMPIVATAVAWLVVVVALAAFLDAVLVPGNPDVRRRAGHTAGWSGAVGGAGWSDGGGHGGSGDGAS